MRGWTTPGVIDLKDQLGILTTLTASRTLLGTLSTLSCGS